MLVSLLNILTLLGDDGVDDSAFIFFMIALGIIVLCLGAWILLLFLLSLLHVLLCIRPVRSELLFDAYLAVGFILFLRQPIVKHYMQLVTPLDDFPVKVSFFLFFDSNFIIVSNNVLIIMC